MTPAGGIPLTGPGGGSGSVAPNIVQGGNLGAAKSVALSASQETWLVGTLNANCVVTATGLVAGARLKVLVSQPSTGGPYTLTLSDGTNTQALAVNTAVDSATVIDVEYDGADLYAAVAGTTGPAGPTGAPGATGAAGTNGTNGAAGADGKTILTTSGAPANGTGTNGDYAYDPAAKVMYGPRSSGAWPAGVSLVGATGPQGPAGPAGPGTGDVINPMTAAADLIVGGTSGTPARLAKGTDGQVLTVDPTTHLLAWKTPSAGGSVATDSVFDAKGDLVVGTGADTSARKAVGTNGRLLAADSTQADGLRWAFRQSRNAGPAAQNLVGWTADPGSLGTTTGTATAIDTLYMGRMAAPEAVTITNVLFVIGGTVAAGITGAYAGVILPDGTVARVSADEAARVNAAAANSLVTMPLSSPIAVGGAGTTDFVYLFIGYDAATTPPTMLNIPGAAPGNAAMNAGLTAGSYRHGTLANTTWPPPGPLTLTSMAQAATPKNIWLAAS